MKYSGNYIPIFLMHDIYQFITIATLSFATICAERCWPYLLLLFLTFTEVSF